MANELSKEVADYIRWHIDSLEQLEILLILQEGSSQHFTLAELNNRIRSSEASLLRRLTPLQSQGVVLSTDDGYRFNVAHEKAELISQVLAAYRDRRLTVTELIFSKPLVGLRSFSDAFKIKEDKGNG